MSGRDRRTALIESGTLNGIDFVAIGNSAQTLLVVHFLNAVPVDGTLTAVPTITGGDTIKSVAVLQPIAASDWGLDGTHVTLVLHVDAPGDFSIYTLTLASKALDAFFATAAFSFKALCPTDTDCEALPPVCPTPASTRPPIDYLAKDFLSFRQALQDFSALRYPNWQERAEADVGMMMLEVLSAVADDLSYTEDRIAAEATLTTATQRRSVMRHARLVDYEPQPAIAAQTVLQFDVAAGTTAINFGVRTLAQASDGTPIVFETGPDLAARPGSAPADALWNKGLVKAYWFDDSTQCLTAGATGMFVLGHGYDFLPGQLVLIETTLGAGQAPARQVVQLVGAGAGQPPWAAELCDGVFLSTPTAPGAGPPWMTCPTSPPQNNPAPTAVTRITWGATDALLVDRDLAQTTVSGNLVRATQGLTFSDESFTVVPAPRSTALPAVVRIGPRATNADGTPGSTVPQYLHTLAGGAVAWLPVAANATDPNPQPEIQLQQLPFGGPSWSWVRWLLEAQPFDTAFTLDPALYRLMLRPDGTAKFDYDGDTGDTVRFGDGSFGLLPDDGTAFSVTYRVGLGAAGNVAAGAVVRIDAGQGALTSGLEAVRNPLPATGGTDAETLDHVRRTAPHAFLQPLERAVTAADYQTIAQQNQAWVQRANTAFRWTGSWLTVFTTPDPAGGNAIAADQRGTLTALLNRCRMAGYESYVPDPEYVSVDVLVQLCALPAFFPADVQVAVLAALTAFFAPADFSFGQALERSALEAAAQAVPGVAGVLCVEARVRGRAQTFSEMADQIVVAANQIIRCSNDPSKPERGLLTVQITGGK
jgi:Baseplate J-like protein